MNNIDKYSDAAIIALMHTHVGMHQMRNMVERSMEMYQLYKKYETESYIEKKDDAGNSSSMPLVDVYTQIKVESAFNCYKMDEPGAAVIMCGSAIEEEFSRLYELIKKKPVPEEMNWGMFKDWANANHLFGDSDYIKKIVLLMYLRNLHAHAWRAMKKATMEPLQNGEFHGTFLPDKEMEIPEELKPLFDSVEAWYQEQNEEAQREIKQAKVGILKRPEVAMKVLELTVDFVIKSSTDYPSEMVELWKETPLVWEDSE